MIRTITKYKILLFTCCWYCMFFISNIQAQDAYCAKVDYSYAAGGQGKVTFSATSDKPVQEWYWYFGDQATSREENPTHQYAYAGEYDVCVKVLVNDNCTGAMCKAIRVESGALGASCNLDVQWKYEISGKMLTAKGWSNASNAATYTWNFGNNQTGQGSEVRHEFTENGDYEVCLTVTQPSTTATGQTCTEKSCKKITIGQFQNPCDIKADFTFELSGRKLVAKAVSNVGNTGKYTWKISDGTALEGVEIKHEFKEKGDYEICLNVAKPATTVSQPCSVTVCKKVSVGTTSSPCDFDVDFKFELNGNILAATAVTNAGAGTKYRWKISDGVSLEGQEIKHEFKERGDYEICLNVVKPATTASQICQKTICKKVSVGQISNNDCPLEADFRIIKSNAGFGVQAKSNDSEAEYTWTVEGQNASYTGREVRIPISRPGIYTVCLTVVSRRWECRIKICKRVVIGRSNGIISPNPTMDYIRIFNEDQNITSYALINTSNGLLASQKLMANETMIDVTHLPTGVYFLQVEYEDGTTSIEKIFKQ